MHETDPSTRGATVALWILAVIASLFFLRQAADLLIPIVLAVLLSYVLEPAVAWLERHRTPRTAGASVVMLVILVLAGWGGYSLRDEVDQAVAALPDTARRARAMVFNRAGDGPAASLQRAADELRGVPPRTQPGPGEQQAGTATRERRGQAAAAPEASTPAAPSRSSSIPQALAGAVQQGVSSVLALMGQLTVIFFLAFFLLTSGGHTRARVIEVSGPEDAGRRTAARIIDDINAQVQRFLVVRLITSAVVATLTWAVLAWMGVQHAALWGILAGVFNSIPYFGPVIVSGGLLVVGLAQGGGISQAVQMAGAALVITSLEGWLLTPPLLGKAERMSVLAVFLGLLLWTWLWGAWGTILAVPMLVIVKSVADHVPRLRAIGRLMAP
ncbi:MAG: AI-2E family transporter [Vicinamibacterales bacterium]